jgi:hypothetical protein
MVTQTLSGEIVKHGAVEEKTDGQNIMVSWKGGKLIAARNKGHLKNKGEKALDKDGIKKMFSGRGAIEDAFYFAMKDLESAIGKISDTDKEEIFKSGENFMSLEVIYPATQNVIPYGLSLLIFHGVKEYNDAGDVIGDQRGYGNKLAKIIKDVNAEVQDNFTIDEMKPVSLAKTENFDTRVSYYTSKLDTLQKKFKLKANDNVMMYHQAWWEDFINTKAKKMKYKIPDSVMKGLIQRWAFGDKSYGVNQMKKEIDNEKFLDFATGFDKQDGDHQATRKSNMEPFESLFLELGAEVMSNMTSFMAANPDEAIQKIRADLAKEIKAIRNSNDVGTLDKMKVQLNKIKALGGFGKIVPSEGLTFHYNGKLFKFTGIFAPLNQILGMLKYSR